MRKLLVPYWFLCFVLTHIPLSGALPEGNGFDKLFHFAGYTVLGILLSLNTKKIFRALLILVIYSWADEFTQPYVGRDFEWLDLLADFIGSSFGLILGKRLLSKIFPEK